jgi:crossover junction endodeoxyribonuclease RuvC
LKAASWIGRPAAGAPCARIRGNNKPAATTASNAASAIHFRTLTSPVRFPARTYASGGLRGSAPVREASGPARRMQPVVITLGIDPGTANTGYGIVTRRGGRLVALDGGVIETRAGTPDAARLAAIHARVSDLIAEHGPDCVAVEDVYFGTNARSAFAVGQARGVVLLAAGQAGLDCASYTPQQVKGAVCGTGRADKAQVQRMVQALLSLAELPRPDHAADALAVAICHANAAPMRAALGAVG